MTQIEEVEDLGSSPEAYIMYRFLTVMKLSAYSLVGKRRVKRKRVDGKLVQEMKITLERVRADRMHYPHWTLAEEHRMPNQCYQNCVRLLHHRKKNAKPDSPYKEFLILGMYYLYGKHEIEHAWIESHTYGTHSRRRWNPDKGEYERYTVKELATRRIIDPTLEGKEPGDFYIPVFRIPVEELEAFCNVKHRSLVAAGRVPPDLRPDQTSAPDLYEWSNWLRLGGRDLWLEQRFRDEYDEIPF